MFYVSNLKKCHADETLHVPLEEIQIDAKFHFLEEPTKIVDMEIKKLKRSKIPIVNVYHDYQQLNKVSTAEPFEEPLILSVEDRVGPNKNDVLVRCMLPLLYVERRLDHKAIKTGLFNLEKHVMVVEGEKKKEVKFASKIHMKYINLINGP
nr:FT-interacting protein 1-like [Tanacetum cinerariifolium]